MKKMIALVITAALAAGLVSGCAKQTVTETTAATEAVEVKESVMETETETAAKEKVETVEYDEVKEADVIIVGAGGGGLSAAISAVNAGAEHVIIVEKLGKTGGSLNYTSGSMSGAETVIQELDGIEDTKESYVQDILSNGAGLGNEELIRKYVDEDVDMIQWLWDHGLSDNEFNMQNEKRSVFAPEHQL